MSNNKLKYDIADTVKKNYDTYTGKGDEYFYLRDRAWEICYSFFQGIFKNIEGFNDSVKEQAALHLGCYLASFGMYRNNIMLNSNFKVLYPIIDILRESDSLSKCDIDSYPVDSIFDLKLEMEKKFRCTQINIPGFEQSDFGMLVSKILMGTLGCTPAYDGFFKEGIKFCDIHPHTNFSRRSLKAVIEFYADNDNKEEFENARKYVQTDYKDIEYPIMRIIDMYFWHIGYTESKKNK